MWYTNIPFVIRKRCYGRLRDWKHCKGIYIDCDVRKVLLGVIGIDKQELQLVRGVYEVTDW